MADLLSSERRSQNMAAIKSKDTKPEIYLRKLLFAQGLRFRKNFTKVIGHPDIFLAKYRTAVFVNGCFWHRHANCKFAYTPKTRVEFWNNKFKNNLSRDNFVKSTLREQGLKCLIVWECTLKRMKKDNALEADIVASIIDFLHDETLAYLEL